MTSAGARLAQNVMDDTHIARWALPEALASLLCSIATSVLANELVERSWAFLHGAIAAGVPVVFMADDVSVRDTGARDAGGGRSGIGIGSGGGDGGGG